ncbi:MAG: efflux RND transporter periplasmic adaptor subunit [Planctomycetes bacterium]|nr:efflux RND transporter periplasmic adaptor subunit [Planctomycetota bacterium]
MRNSILPALILLAAVAALLAALFWPKGDIEENAGRGGGGFRFPVTYVEVVSGDASETVELVGDVVSARRSTLAFDRNGTLLAVHARLGDRVTKGQLLAELDDEVLREEHVAAGAALEVAMEQAEYAERVAKRSEEIGAGVVADSEADRLRSEAKAAKARVQQQQAATRKLKAQLERGKLVAPFGGIVAQRLLDEGAQTGPANPVLDLVDPERREVRLEVPAQLVGSLQPGSPVELTLDEKPDFKLQLALHALIPATELGSRSFTAVVRLDQTATADLLPGLFVRARLTLRKVENQLLVPVDSVLQNERGHLIVVADAPAAAANEAAPSDPPPASKARFVPIRILVNGAELVAIQALQPDALKAGDRVLVTGVQNVFPGADLGLKPHPAATAEVHPQPAEQE